MKKRWLGVALVALLALLPLGGCKLYGNVRTDTRSVASEETATQLKLYLGEGETLVFDKTRESLSLDKNEDYRQTSARVVLHGDTSPRRTLSVDEEFGPLKTKLLERARDPELPLIQAYALEGEAGTAYGFYNDYTSTSGFLSGGGHLGVEKAYCGSFFFYDAASEVLLVTETVKHGCIVAASRTHFVYYYKRAYYARDVLGTTEVKICRDDAFDTGITHYSYADFYFSGDYCVLKFHRGYNNFKRDYDRYVLCTMNGTILCELKTNVR